MLKEYNFNHKEYCIVTGTSIIADLNPIEIKYSSILSFRAFNPRFYSYVNKEFIEKQREAKAKYLEDKIELFEDEGFKDQFLAAHPEEKDLISSSISKRKEEIKEAEAEEITVEEVNPFEEVIYSQKKPTPENLEKIAFYKSQPPFDKYIKTLFDEIKPLENEDESKLNWELIKQSTGTYFGTVNKWGIFHGRGIYIFKNSRNYSVSNFFMGKRSGCCRIYDKGSDNLVYSGNYKNEAKEGFGVFYFGNGEKYEGYFKRNKMEGKGKYFYANGAVWEGNFKENVMHGVGRLTLPDKKASSTVSFDMGKLVKEK